MPTNTPYIIPYSHEQIKKARNTGLFAPLSGGWASKWISSWRLCLSSSTPNRRWRVNNFEGRQFWSRGAEIDSGYQFSNL